MAEAAAPPPDKPTHPDKPYFACAPSDVSIFSTAPIVLTFQKDLPATPDQLFDVFEDPTSWSRWAHGIGRVVWTSPRPYGVGTTRTVYFWGGMEVYEDFIRWERGQEMAFVFYGTTQNVFDRFGERYRVQPMERGCRLTWTVALEPASSWSGFAPLVVPLLRANLASYMWRLGRYVRSTVSLPS
jgi:hypothetical protein